MMVNEVAFNLFKKLQIENFNIINSDDRNFKIITDLKVFLSYMKKNNGEYCNTCLFKINEIETFSILHSTKDPQKKMTNIYYNVGLLLNEVVTFFSFIDFSIVKIDDIASLSRFDFEDMVISDIKFDEPDSKFNFVIDEIFSHESFLNKDFERAEFVFSDWEEVFITYISWNSEVTDHNFRPMQFIDKFEIHTESKFIRIGGDYKNDKDLGWCEYCFVNPKIDGLLYPKAESKNISLKE